MRVVSANTCRSEIVKKSPFSAEKQPVRPGLKGFTLWEREAQARYWRRPGFAASSCPDAMGWPTGCPADAR